ELIEVTHQALPDLGLQARAVVHRGLDAAAQVQAELVRRIVGLFGREAALRRNFYLGVQEVNPQSGARERTDLRIRDLEPVLAASAELHVADGRLGAELLIRP